MTSPLVGCSRPRSRGSLAVAEPGPPATPFGRRTDGGDPAAADARVAVRRTNQLPVSGSDGHDAVPAPGPGRAMTDESTLAPSDAVEFMLRSNIAESRTDGVSLPTMDTQGSVMFKASNEREPEVATKAHPQLTPEGAA